MRLRLAAVILLSVAVSGAGLAQTATQRPITRNSISSLPAQEAAQLVLGPTGGTFVTARQATFTPLRSVDPNSVLDFLIFTSKPVPAQGWMCRTTRLVVEFAPIEPNARNAANADTAVRPVDVRAQERFVVVDSVSGVRNASSGDRERIMSACERLPPTATTFQASSDFTALRYAAALDLVIRAAARQDELFFTLSCQRDGRECDNGREQLSALSPKAIQSIGRDTCVNGDRDRSCYALIVDDTSDGNFYWEVEIVCNLPADRPVSVSLRRWRRPVV